MNLNRVSIHSFSIPTVMPEDQLPAAAQSCLPAAVVPPMQQQYMEIARKTNEGPTAKAGPGIAPTHWLLTQSAHSGHCPACSSEVTSHAPVATLHSDVPQAPGAKSQGLGVTGVATQPVASAEVSGAHDAVAHAPNPPGGANPLFGSLKARLLW